ncbi:MAG TPA: type II secretion system F family protein [Xanthobacteraceae bacterium]|nr:type II secretion system F family protein [Xanthobacteraceae bacterium]
MDLNTLAFAFLGAVAIGGLAWVFLYPLLSGERQIQKRVSTVARTEPVVRAADRNSRSRREQVELSLKELEEKNKESTKRPLNVRIAQAGLNWSVKQFLITSTVLGASAFLLMFLAGFGLPSALGLGFAAGFGAPRWLLNHLKKRREKKFLQALPDAVDIIVRGIKAGLPLFDSIRVVTADSPEPLRSEFMAIVDSQAIGMPLGEACVRLYERMPLPEANFFGIVVSIQQKSGGNLSEALGNLSKVLRDRKRMSEKIQAMSMEAKASAAIIGSLPPIVMLLVFLTTPDYISLLWTHPTGRLMLAGSALWMAMGVFVMKKMINFDF